MKFKIKEFEELTEREQEIVETNYRQCMSDVSMMCSDLHRNVKDFYYAHAEMDFPSFAIIAIDENTGITVYHNAFNVLKKRIDILNSVEKEVIIEAVTEQIEKVLLNKDIHVCDISEKSCKVTFAGTPATLVLEEDNSVNWYVIPDRHSDLKLLDVHVDVEDTRTVVPVQVCKGCNEIYYDEFELVECPECHDKRIEIEDM